MKSARALTILVTLIGILAACTVTTDNKETPVTSISGPSGQPEFSLLTDSGVEQIKDSRRARFDFRDLTLTNAEVGLPSTHKQDVIIGGAGKPDIELTFLGPEAGDTVNTQTIWITTHYRGGQFEDLIFWRSFDTNEGAQQELAQATTRWGILAEKVETWKSIASQAGENKEKWSLGNGIGPTGLIVGLNASIKNGVQVFQYTLNLDPRNYTPENMANIRETGLSRRVIN